MPTPALIAIGFALGAWSGPRLALPPGPLVVALALLALSWTGLVLWRRGPRVLLLVLLSAIAGLTARRGELERQERTLAALATAPGATIWAGEILDDAGAPLAGRALLVALHDDRLPGPARVELALRDEAAGWPRLSPGTGIRFRARLVPPAPAWMPGQFDFRSLALARGILAHGTLHHRDQLLILEAELPATPAIGLARLRLALRARVDAALDSEASALTRAVVLGDRSDVDQELRRPFDGAGAGHLLAVSGLHVGSLAGAVFALVAWLCRRWEWLMRRLPPRRLAALLAAPTGLGFALIAGASPSALRAGVMSLAVLIGIALWRPRATTSALGLAALVLLGHSPASVDDPSFVLSFAAVAAILFGAPRLVALARAHLPVVDDIPVLRGAAVLAATLAAGLVSIPLGAAFFGRVAPWGVLANLIIVPAAALGLPASIGAVLLGLALGALGLVGVERVLVQLGASAVLALRDLSAAFAALPGALLEVPPPSTLATACLLVGLALLLLWDRGRRLRAVALALVGLGLLLPALPSPRWPGQLELRFLPVGQGDATLVRGPDGHTLLVDGGAQPMGERDVGREVILPALRRAGVDRLDVLVLTHPDYDHYSGLATTLQEYCPAELWWTGQADEDPAWQRLQDAIDRCGTRRRRFDLADHVVDLGALRVEVLHPLVDAAEPLRHWPELDRNDNSLVLLLTHGEVRVLLTGDAGTLVEDSLRERGLRGPLQLLKAGHHGSGHSTGLAFLRALRPAHTVISAGHFNRFGHPAPALLERLAAVESRVWRTDRHGLIVATSDGRELRVRGFRSVQPVPYDATTQISQRASTKPAL